MDLTIAIDILLFIAGAALVIFGADWLVDGASGIARRSGLSEFVIGATIVGIGTSMPEFVVSAVAAIRGNADIAIGNVAGSNLFNTLMILGVTAMVLPLLFSRSNIRFDMPACIAASLLFLLFSLDGTVNRYEGGILFLLFIAYIWYNIKKGKGEDGGEDTAAKEPPMAVWKMILLILAGLAGLVLGGNLFVEHGVNLAHEIGISEAVIANTLMAGGTSLPELAVCVVAAAKGRGQMAIGNIIGSNISNILLIVGFSAAITPLNVLSVNLLSIYAVAASAVLLLLSALPLRTSRLTRWEGALFIALYVAYVVGIIMLGN
ncbi:MAG: calcium/sodium antiporter [Bacteroidales bacterium]|nr:calcium/sodium antiporter [Bacteroidales bacterium]